ncbi:MAG: hypothetical protein ACOYXM_17820 [Actinomycetota bacterium]
MARTPTPIGSRPKDLRFAALAAVLSRAVAAGELEATHALRILRHQLRVMNVNGATKVPRRSEGAQAVIDRYAEAGDLIPKNGSSDALHCDHVHSLTADDLTRLVSVEEWITELPRLVEVVCVTAAENYRLEKLERDGVTGPTKYEMAGIRVLPPVAN